MLNSLISLHSYLIVNAAIGIAYVISRISLSLSGTTQWQRLKFARYSLIFTVIIFLLMPSFLTLVPSQYHSTFQIEPILRSASSGFLSHKSTVDMPIQISSTEYHFSIYDILIYTLLLGIGISFIKYIKNMMVLNQLQKESFCQHKIKNISILFNKKCNIPFCWGYLNNHFICLPDAMLERNNDLTIAIRHELQHIRQGDTHWLHVMAMMKAICFWNPFVGLWSKLLEELQELSCDEAIVLKNKSMPAVVYAECLMNAAGVYLNQVPEAVLGVHKLSKSFLYRRINMLFNYKPHQSRKLATIITYALLLFTSITAATAFNGTSNTSPLTMKQVAAIVQEKHIDKNFLVEVKPEVVNEINNIRGSEQARSFMRASLQRMKTYQPIIQTTFKKESVPNDLLVIPLVESGYQPLDQSKNPMLAAGIWQIIPETGKHLGLVINKTRDDRLNTQLATKAAVAYLKANYAQFNDWRLALAAYEIGEIKTDELIKEAHSRDVWVLANSPSAPEGLKKFLARLDASLIIMHDPSLVN